MKNSKYTILVTAISVLFFVACSSKKDNEEISLATLLVLTSGFSDNFDGTVNQGSLMWMKCSQGQVWSGSTNNCQGSGGGTTWNAVSLQFCSVLTGNYSDCTTADTTTPTAISGPAFDSCSNLAFGGQTDWRMPTKAELELMVLNTNRASFLTLFPETPDDKFFWSSTGNKDKSDGSEASGINFSNSNFATSEFASKDAVKYVRCVRNK